MYSAINGYGIPKDILKDRSYHSYLGQIFNYLWDEYRNARLTILLLGGVTDMQKPYRRTEAEEMARWLKPRIASLKLGKRWKVLCLTSGLDSLENMQAARQVIRHNQCIYFCEKTRERKIKALAARIFGRRCSVKAIDFDTSHARYDIKTREAMERDDLRHSLRALHDVRWAKKLRASNELKIKTLRAVSEKQRAREIDRITLQVRREFLKK